MSINADKTIAVRTSKIIYRACDHVIKVFDTDYSKSDVLNEALNQARVEETGLNIPSILEVTKLEGKWVIISEYIKGKTLQQLMIEYPERKEEYIELFVNLQLTIHQKSVPSLNKLKDKMNRKISESDFDATTRYELHARLESFPKHKKLCHGDFNPGNIIINDEEKVYIIDWSHATQGNASADAAITYLYFQLTKDIESAEKYLDLFCQKSNTTKEYLQKWLPIVAASQSVKGREDEREFLCSWVNI